MCDAEQVHGCDETIRFDVGNKNVESIELGIVVRVCVCVGIGIESYNGIDLPQSQPLAYNTHV